MDHYNQLKTKYDTVISDLKKLESSNKKLLSKYEQDISKKLDLFRIDVKNVSTVNPYSQVAIKIEETDAEVIETTPAWFSKDQKGIGHVLQCHGSFFNFSIEALNDGKLSIAFRATKLSLNGYTTPLFINCKQLQINDQQLISEDLVVSHDWPRKYEINVKQGDVIFVKTVWEHCDVDVLKEMKQKGVTKVQQDSTNESKIKSLKAQLRKKNNELFELYNASESIKVSVIIPIYNAARFLDECLASVINQTIRNIEIICVDDGSEDNSVEIIQRYQLKDKRIKLLKQSNLGAGAARNIGIQHAKGDYLFFADADDYCELDLLEKTLKKAKEHDADIVAFDDYRFFDDGKSELHSGININRLPKGIEVFSYKDVPEYICAIVNVTPWNKLISREFVVKNNIRFMELSTSNDITFSALCNIFAKRIAFVKEPLYHYRLGHTGTITTKKQKNLDNIIKAVLAVDSRAQSLSYYEELKVSIRSLIADNLFAGLDRYAVVNTIEAKQYEENVRNLFVSYPLFSGKDGGNVIDRLRDRVKLLRNGISL